ncbi:efflux RND transporter periplasmic adaptor subunit [Photobacterium sanctipauli]|uniref:efflux RND transporter periplasmic adaptor subunit n=1 Tax=Photobacterium sanctipauli TaxID=1342794 RepID=UPI000567CA23|nr:efflux RND transporter periplasmic adaptor subunit [Photobacterium sanctipauli]
MTTSPSDFQYRFAGTTVSASTINLSFQVGGTLESFPAKAGLPLKNGELIASLNDDDLQLELQKNEALLEQAKTNSVASTSRYERMASLHKKQLISDMDFDVAQAEHQVNIAKVDQAQRAVDLSRQQISYASLYARGDHCSITETHATENENVASGQLIAVLSCGNNMEVTANVSEATIAGLSIGQDVTAMIGAVSKESMPATISEIGLSTGNTGTYFVTATINSEIESLRPGMGAELLINRERLQSNQNLWVPMNTVNEENGQHFVMIFEPAQDSQGGVQGIVRKVPVTIGKFIAGSIEVTHGLSEGQQVITAGQSQVYDGLEVTSLNGGEHS